MKSKVITLAVIFALILIPFSTASADELKNEVQKANFYASQYESGNTGYAKFVTQLASVKENANAIIKRDGLKESDIRDALGAPSGQTISVRLKDEQNAEQLENPVSKWDKVEYDGKTQVRVVASPVISNNQVIYDFDLNLDFTDDRPSLNAQNGISEIQDLAREYNLNPSDISLANRLAESMVSFENLFRDYEEQSPLECEELMMNTFGEQNKISRQVITDQTFLISNEGGTKVEATVERCDNCQGVETKNWINFNVAMTENGRSLTYLEDNPTTKEQFADMGINEIKKNLIDLNRAMQDLLSARNYRGVYGITQRIMALNSVWNDRLNEGTAIDQQLNYADAKRFYVELMSGYKATNSYVDQTTYGQDLFVEFNNVSEEICTNQVDDNDNGDIDCQEYMCAGQQCGSKTVTSFENNQTIQTEVPLYCISGMCQEKQETIKDVGPVCGNFICEEGEDVSCQKDCVTCQTYSPITCSGQVILSGTDSNGCALPPVCIPKDNSCTSNSQCAQPLCGVAECVEGQCKTTSLKECTQSKCTEGQEKTQSCKDGKTIVSEICSQNEWKITGNKCDIALTFPEVITKGEGSACKLATDCKAGLVCSSGQCKEVALKSTSPKQTSSGANFLNGVTTTGQVVAITGEAPLTGTGITGIVPDPDPTNTGVLENPEDYVKPTKTVTGSSPLTGVVNPTDKEQQTFDTIVTIGNTKTTQNLRELKNNEKEVLSVRGYCSKDNENEQAVLAFDGGGENMDTVMALKERYEEDGSPEYSQWKLDKLVREREELRDSFDEDFVRWFFEEHLANTAEDWEGKANAILDLHRKNIENQIVTAREMDSLGITKLVNYNLINIDYTSSFGILSYHETVKRARFEGMRSEVEIISPSLKLEIYPSKAFIRTELQKSMTSRQFIGSVESTAEREAEFGLTKKEKLRIRSDPEIIGLIEELSNSYNDGNLDIQIMLKDGDSIVYNVYAKINPQDIVKAQVMLPEQTPTVDAKIEINSFNNIYDIIESSRKTTYAQDSPWDNGFTLSDMISSTITWIDLQRKIRNLEGSVQVTGKSSDKIKDLFMKVFFIIGEDEDARNSADLSTGKEKVTLWNNRGAKVLA